MHRPSSLSVFLLFFLITDASAADVAGAGGERAGLLQLKSSVSDPTGILSGWTAASYHCSWHGVSCDAGGRVVAINISAAAGVPPDFCSLSLPFRTRCPVAGPRLAGKLSPAIGMLADLRIISLPFHSFDGEMPGEIWSLKSLEVVDLEGGSLVGTLPSRFPHRLRVLNLASNLITGEIPLSLFLCVHLETLDLSFNRLEKSIPEEIGAGCSSLEHLDLSGNFLFGSIPSSLGNCSQLQSLLLFSNRLDGVIPSDLGRLKKLRALDVSRNRLRGSVPEELGNCKELALLVLMNLFDPILAGNSLIYGDKDEFNYFHGGISWKITGLPMLRILWAPRGNLDGEFSSYWGGCERLEMVNLGQNHFTGEVSRDLDKCVNLKFLDLSLNKLTGWLSEKLPVPCMDFFDVSGNRLSGSIPSFIQKQCPMSPFSANDDLLSAYSLFFRSRTVAEIELPFYESSRNSAVYHNFGRNMFSGTLSSLPVATERYGKLTVYALRVDGNSIAGSLTDGVFGNCRELGGLAANFNSNLISGEIPLDIGIICRALMVLNVANNQIRGVLPQSIVLLDKLVALDLSTNQLKGQIPDGLSSLKCLKYLSLGNNNFSGGIISGLGQSNSIHELNLSSYYPTGENSGAHVKFRKLSVFLLRKNKLSGKETPGFANVTSSISASHLQGRSMVSQTHIVNENQTEPQQSEKRGSGLSSIWVAIIASAAGIVSVLLALLVLYICSRKCMPSSSVQVQSSEVRAVTIFVDIGIPLTYESVVTATGNFNGSNCIGSGGFGATYKAEVSPGVLVAIKRLSVGRLQGVQQFHAEIKTLGRWRHPNLVTLLGYYGSDSEMFLIYNYLPGGNLERFLHERSRRDVEWRMLHKIASDVARAIAYLHDQCVPRILHRDVKPSNILLDNEFNAYLSDFGLARLLGNSQTHATTGVAGTFGYVAPEYAMTCRVSDKADVYSYGVVLLELLSDKKALDPSFSLYGDGFNIVAWASMLLHQGRVHEFFTEGLWHVAPHQQLIETLKLAITCTKEQLSQRPSMKQVARMLKELYSPAS